MTRSMQSRGLLAPVVLVLVAAALVAVIWLELHSHFRDSGTMTPPSAAVLPTVPAGHPAAPDPGRIAQWAAAILARPLFSPDRRPPGVAVADAPVAVAPSLPRVAGIVVTPAGRRAIFAEKGTKPLVLGEGGQVGGFTVQSIQAGQVTVRGPEGVRVLSPTFDPDAPAPPPPGAAPPPPSLSVPGLPGFQLPARPPGFGGIPGLAAPPPPGPAPRAAR